MTDLVVEVYMSTVELSLVTLIVVAIQCGHHIMCALIGMSLKLAAYEQPSYKYELVDAIRVSSR